jgi:ribose transport system ATP-binding protein
LASQETLKVADAGSDGGVAAFRVGGLTKVFPGVVALDDFSLEIGSGTVHALVGPNGCGKSTFVKILAGVYKPDAYDEASIDGVPVQLGSADAALEAGVRFVHQDLGVVGELDAVDNVALGLGYDRTSFRTVSWRDQRRTTRELLDRFGVAVALDVPLMLLTPVERAAVAIVRALAGGIPGKGLLVLDEPTAALPHREVHQLYKLVREVRATGTAVLLISHRLDEVMEIADTVSVMRAGRLVGAGPISEMSVPAMVAMITGGREDLANIPEKRGDRRRTGTPFLSARRVYGRHLRGVDFDLHEGEIVGIAGLLGSGREELPYAVAGAAGPEVTGDFIVDGNDVGELDLQEAMRSGIALVPADRAAESVVLGFNVCETLSLPTLHLLRRRGLLSGRAERSFVKDWLELVQVRSNAVNAPIESLSGGNQQKVVVGRWLATKPKVLVMSEPTAGIDIGARVAVYDLIRAQAANGLSVLVASSDVQDLLHVCDRVLILRDGVVAGEVEASKISESAIVDSMEGVQ